jgi:Calcineurin-like phosphoesterase/RTX calcium-binding nonapeptide repeat (4 copies)
MPTLNSSKSRLSHKELWGLVRDDDSSALQGQDAGDAAAPRGGNQDDRPIWLQVEDPDQTAPQGADWLDWLSGWAAAWSVDVEANTGPGHFRHAGTGATSERETAERSEREKAVGVSSDTTISASGESPAATMNSQDGLQLILTHDLESGPAAAGGAHCTLNASIQESTSLADPSVDSGGTIATAALLATAANQPPTDVTLLADQPFNENIAGATVGTLSATDPDAGDTHTFSVSDSRFEVVGDQLKLKDGVRLDFEREPQVNLDVTATDSGGLSFTQTFAISVGDVPEVRFAAFGDYGSRSDAQAVADLVDSLNVDFITTLGDNLYFTDPIDVQIGQFYSNYIGNYVGAYGPGSPTNRFFPSIGNHEYSDPAGGVNASAYFDYFTLPGNERYYDFTKGPIHFFVVNSEPEEPDGRSSTSVQAQWLQSGLANSTSPYNFVYFHRPPYSSGSSVGGSTTMQWPFEQWGATAVFSGHVHNYERILRDANADGIVLPYFVSGMGAGGGASFGTPVEGSAARYNADNGTMLVQVCATSCTFEFWSIAGGGTLIDSYTIDVIDQPPAQEPLFTTGNDVVDFNSITADSYLADSQYNALAGDDTVTLPLSAAAASAAGYDPIQTFSGSDGNDAITGGNLNDTINGEAGTDTLAGGAGDDTLDAGIIADTLIGGAGNDLLDGGSNNDTVDYAAAGAVTVNLALGTASGDGNDTLSNVENVIGSDFDDTITGNTLVNVLTGGGGNDMLLGGAGNDTLTGGAGIDQLFGDAGHDTLKWDTADKFDGGDGFDTLDAILSSADTIDLRGANFANLERVRTGSGKDNVTLSLNDVLSDTADNQFVADLASSSPDTLKIDITGGWSATTPNTTLGPTAVAAGISVSGMTAYTFTNGQDTVTVFTNAEVVNAQTLTS